MRLADWFTRKEPDSHVLPMNPRAASQSDYRRIHDPNRTTVV